MLPSACVSSQEDFERERLRSKHVEEEEEEEDDAHRIHYKDSEKWYRMSYKLQEST